MAGSRVCPHCGRLNGIAETRCNRCGRGFPGPLVAFTRDWLGVDFVATRVLVLACTGIFALLALDHGGMPWGIRIGPLGGAGFLPSEVLRWGALAGDLGSAEPFRRLAAIFVHFGVIHLGLNLLSLVDFGSRSEGRLGTARYLVVFAVTGFVGFWISDLWYLLSQGGSPLTGGASGSLFGLMGAEIGWLRARRDPAFKDTLVRFFVYALLFALMVPVNNAAHLGGFVMGWLLGWLLEKTRPSRQARLLFLTSAVLAAVGLSGAVLLSLSSPVWQEQRRFELKQQGRGELEFS